MSKHVLPLFPSPVSFSRLDISDVEILNENNFEFIKTGDDSEQSYITKDIRVLEQYPRLKKLILDNFTEYMREYFTYEQEFLITTSWMTKIGTGCRSSFHNHKNSFYSGVYYFGECDEHTGRLEFNNPLTDLSSYQLIPKEYSIQSSDSWKIRPQKNLVVFFPSYLYHRIGEHSGEKTRFSLAFNIVPIGSYGHRDSFHNTNWHT